MLNSSFREWMNELARQMYKVDNSRKDLSDVQDYKLNLNFIRMGDSFPSCSVIQW